MDKFKIWCKLICIIIIAGGIILSLLPEGYISSAIKGLISVVIIYCLISPLENKDKLKFDSFLKSDTEKLKTDLIDQNESLIILCAENMLEERIDGILNEISVDLKSSVSINESDDYVKIDKVKISGCDDNTDTKLVTEKIIVLIGEGVPIEFVG